MDRRNVWMGWAVLALLVVVIVLLGTFLLRPPAGFTPDLGGEAQYYAVALVGGQLYYGKPTCVVGGTIELADVYYVARQADPETEELHNTLVYRRRSEWHGPTKMILNAGNVLLMEPVDPASTVAKRIAEQRASRD